MPQAQSKPCSCHGCRACIGRCPNSSREGGRCEACLAEQRKHDHSDAAISRRPFYRTKRWQALRRVVLREEPFCQVEGCLRASVDVDHVIPWEDGGAQWARSNLQGLCKSHHSQKTMSETMARRKRSHVTENVHSCGHNE